AMNGASNGRCCCDAQLRRWTLRRRAARPFDSQYTDRRNGRVTSPRPAGERVEDPGASDRLAGPDEQDAITRTPHDLRLVSSRQQFPGNRLNFSDPQRLEPQLRIKRTDLVARRLVQIRQARDDGDRKARMALAETVEEAEAIDEGHLQIEHDRVGRGFIDQL